MQTKAILALADVTQVLDAAQKEAEREGWAITVAVADDGGHLLALRRLDGAAPFTADVAAQKARSAAMGRKETQVFEEMINGGRTAFISAPLQGLLSGGVPIIIDGNVVGAVGISGVKPDQDVQVAKAAVSVITS
ncbi:heme-binding protein [Halomonas llamarensis]|uniref:Heme-binding protein n=1 Tax=Halomonas llamarensis TaxID=2945104 RepID=A0ABT0SKW1_9GAMM|nr:heme-binding protein [Halomonas llamarensis]MCL7928441.1 heme-binding protein [Halomonas llamarensis]